MIPILNPNDMYSLDSHLINNIGIESKLLMENAAVYISNNLKEIVTIGSKILIICGPGNNGGDGLALVRHLHNEYKVSFVIVGNKENQSEDNKYNFNLLKSLDITESDINTVNFNDFDCIIDSIYGIGSRLPLDEVISEIIDSINKTKCLKIAIDIPTGLNSLNGIASESTFKSDYTYTMYAEKTGLLLNDGKDYSGDIIVMDLGIPRNVVVAYSNIFKYSELNSLRRENNTSKFNYGKCVVIAGSESMSGAAALTCNASISSGAGLVYLITTNKNYNILPEIITKVVNDYDESMLNNNDIKHLIDKSDSIVIGPGLGKSTEITNMINSILESYPNKKYIIDADAISILDLSKKYSQNITITPHLGEFANLLGKEKKDIIENLVDLVKETAFNMKINILLKGATSIISDGEEVILVSDGVPEMATAGSGDVLSGILGSQVNLDSNSKYLHIIANSALTHINAAKISLKNSSKLIASDIIKGLKCIK